MAKRIMRQFRLDEISAVDRPAQAHAKMVLMKRDFSASARRSDAKSGAALPDGSFPIENEGDLRNAEHLVGHAKDPAKARAHIQARAKALGLSSHLKRETGMFGKIAGLLFGQRVEEANKALEKSIKTIVDDNDAPDKDAMISETIKQFGEHLTGKIQDDFDKAMTAGSAAEAGNSGAKDEGIKMSEAIIKALGLSAEATEDEIITAIAARDEEIAKAKAEADKVKDLPPDVVKILADAKVMEKRLADLEEERLEAKFEKKAFALSVEGIDGSTLRKAYAGDETTIDSLIKMVADANAAVAHSDVFREYGSVRGVDGDEFDQLTAKAAELRKSQPELTEAQAFTKVYTDPSNAALAKAERRKNRPVAN